MKFVHELWQHREEEPAETMEMWKEEEQILQMSKSGKGYVKENVFSLELLQKLRLPPDDQYVSTASSVCVCKITNSMFLQLL